MKKILTVLFSLFLIFGFSGISGAGSTPYSIGNVTDFLNDSTYFNGYHEITTAFDFSGEWWYTAVAFESGNINYTSESIAGPQTFTTASTGNFGTYDTVNFDTANLYFSDGSPADVALDAFDPTEPFFKLFQLDADSNALSYLASNPVFSANTYFIGFNDNDLGTGDLDFDDIIVAAAPAPVPEPATMLLLGTGLIGLAGLRRRFKK